MKNIIAAVVAGLVMFFWGFVSWTVLPWHNVDVSQFSDQQVVMDTLLQQSPKSGIYFIPGDQADYDANTPGAFVNVMKNGFGAGMGEMMAKGIVGNIVLALLAILLLAKTSLTSYGSRVGFMVMLGLLIGLAANIPYWNWFGFPTGYILVNITDYVVTWLLAGLVIAKLAKP